MDAKTHWKKADENQGTVCIIYLYTTLSLSLLSLSRQRREREKPNVITKLPKWQTV